MKFTDIYKDNKFHFSIEVFPPKTAQGVLNLFKELDKLKTMKPVYVSVTYGAMGSTRDLTSDLALQIHNQLQMNTASHFTCIGSSQEDIKNYVKNLHEHGVDLIVALRGDHPHDDPDYKPPQDGFRYANELVSYLKTLNDFSIAVAGYPETHIEAISPEDDLKNLKRKVEAGADVIITQLFFDNKDFYSWVQKVRDIGINVPIIAGIMPILKTSQIQRIAKMCGSKIPTELMQQLEACGDNEDAMQEVGIGWATNQCRDLIQNHVAGIHFYCLNKSYSVLKIVEACKDLIK